MEQTWRWYGPNDPVPLADVHQADATGVVTALHHIPNGGVWSAEEILKRRAIVEDAGLVWSVVESVPIHEDIKTRTSNYGQWIVNYQQILHNLAQCGIRTMCYSLILVFDWARTDLKYMLPDDSGVLRFGQVEFTVFEMHILRRPGTKTDYTREEIAQAAERLTIVSDEDKARLTRDIIADLLGVGEGYILDQFRKRLELYKDIGKAKLRENFAVFLKAIIPVAEEVGVRMAVYSNNSPRPIPGLPRIVSTIEDMQWMIDTVDSIANGFTMCTGFYGAHADSDLVNTIRQSGPRIYFTHLRSIMREDNPRTFHETAHLNDDIDMYGVVKAIVEGERRRKVESKEDLIPMYPGHGHQMLDDLKKKINPGYPAIGRLKGLAEAHGVELAIQRIFFSC